MPPKGCRHKAYKPKSLDVSLSPSQDEILLNAMAAKLTLHHPEVVELWQEAKLRLGVREAGDDLYEFIRKNTTLTVTMTATTEDAIQPLEKAEGDIRAGKRSPVVHSTGSDSPLTYDCFMPIFIVDPWVSLPTLFDKTAGKQLAVQDGEIIVRRGRWEYTAIAPKAHGGLRLMEGERVAVIGARFTMPFEMARIVAEGS
ncbi:hypothetical protein BV25DRAFT_1912436 [Artomyces pyxidatus]|uniref:Uncharacterized protein n=1 Tax=Artomyces pyxidatus TaxID=48021 RepID=A0ACB8TFA9_9AGAM|nr:hypothetical protein BV25DRAFT_1912436 [Artomyces pyxidatus]